MRKVKVSVEICNYYKGLRKVRAVYTPGDDEKFKERITALFWAMPKDSILDLKKTAQKMILKSLKDRETR